MNADRKFVEEHIEEIHDNGVCLWVSLDQIYTFSPSAGKPMSDAYAQLRAYTEARLKQIAEVEEEIDCLEIFGPGEDWMDVHQVVVFARIFAVEQDRLRELRKGMKETK